MYELKTYRGVICHATKNDAKLERELTCRFKTDRTLMNFDPSTRKSQTFALY